MASALIAHNGGRLGKILWTEVPDGERVRVHGVWDGKDEARFAGDEIEALHVKGHRLGEIAVLVRAGFQTREFEERLIVLGIPYRVIGGPRFYERMEIRDAIAYFRVIVQPDDDLAFERIVNVPKRGLGPATMQTARRAARRAGVPLTEAARRLVETDELKPRARNALVRLMAHFDRWRSLLDVMSHHELADLVLDESGYLSRWRNEESPDAPGRLENLVELVAALIDFQNLESFLEHVSLVMENEDSEPDDKVSLMTLHGAKGLEFDTVFLPGWEEGLFPHPKALDEGELRGLEEERRLAYVGLTRARRRVIVTHAANRRVFNRWQSPLPSRFIYELPAENIDRTATPGISGAGAAGLSASLRDPLAVFGGGRPPGQRRPRLVKDADREVTVRDGSEELLAAGQRIFHQKFGYGHVVAVDGDKLEVAFEKAGTKKVMSGFVEAV